MRKMSLHTELSVVLANEPGSLAGLCQELAKEKINLLAAEAAGGFHHNLLRLVIDDASKAKKILSRKGYYVGETDVVCLALPHEPGALAEVANTLSKSNINIEYFYTAGETEQGKVFVVMHPSEPAKAAKLLADICV
jgi:hypothetical protein